MTKRLIETGLRAALLLVLAGASLRASERRMTPLVRAIQRGKTSVVNIHTVKTSQTGESLFAAAKPRKVNGMGTGIVVDERGYIVTNYHVVHGVDSMRVTLDDGSTYTSKVIRFDREHDLAIIKINATRPLPVMPLGTSSDLMLGETVVAVGNAYGYEHTITSGIVSALSRDVEVNEKQAYKNLIQTDASINPGNSGGPLLNLDGEVVGINVAIRAGAQRIGFAIPIDDARLIIADLMSVEHVNGTYHGLLAQDVKDARERFLRVQSAEPNSPAARAGFQTGDRVLKVGSLDVVDGVDFERALLGRSENDEVDVQVRRQGKTVTLKLALESLNAPDAVVRANNDNDDENERIWRQLGVRLAELNDHERRLVAPRYRGGMRVLGIRDGSPADNNGIQRGDLLVGLHIWETISRDNVTYVLNQTSEQSFNPLKFYIVRGKETLFGHLRLAAAGR